MHAPNQNAFRQGTGVRRAQWQVVDDEYWSVREISDFYGPMDLWTYPGGTYGLMITIGD